MATASRRGSAEGMAAAFQSAAKTLELQYDVPLQAHVPLEPMNAVAHWTPQRCEVWAQVEGSIVFALTAALKGAITVEQGRIQQSNFHDYPLLRIDEMPLIETVLVDSTAAPTGIGEPASHAVAAALSNAIFAASGKRWRSTPMRA